MQRKKLLELPIDTADRVPAMQHIEEYIETSYGTNYKINRYNFCYTAFVDNSTGEDVLIVDVYKPAPQAELMYRLFQTAEKWFSVDAKGKISERSLFWEVGGYWTKNVYHAFDDADKVIGDYIKNHNNFSFYIQDKGILQIRKWQDHIREQRLKNKYDRIKESISQEMLEIHPLSQKVKDWIINSVMKENRYLFYDTSKKKQTIARCSHCGNTVEIDTPKRNMCIRCPCCKSMCTAKPYKAYLNTDGFEIRKEISYLQPLKDKSFCFRKFTIHWYFNKSTRPSKYIYENHRTFINIEYGNFNERSNYDYDASYQGGDWRKSHSYGHYESYIYPGTLNKIFKCRPGFNKYHIDFNKIARICNPISLEGLYNSTNKVEFLMNLVNSGLTHLARSVINCYGYAGNRASVLKSFEVTKGSLRKGCGITKDDLPFLKKLNPDLKEFDLFVTYQRSGRPMDFTAMQRLFEIRKKTGLTSGFLNKILQYSSLGRFVKYFDYLETSYFKKCNWKYSWESPYITFISDFEDYIDNLILLEYNLKNYDVLYPKNFNNAHDTVYKIVNDESFRNAELPQIARQYQKYNQMFYFEYKDLFIRPPKNHNEVKIEGEKLSHCVASYAKRIATEETIILFIRKKSEPDSPYFTLNLDPVNFEIIQNRGKNNCTYPAEVKKFMDKWYAEKIEPLKRGNNKCQKIA